MNQLIPMERIENKIYMIRGQKVMIDRDLAELYGVETRLLKQAVKRNIKRFPPDFMFRLTKKELENWRSLIVMSNSDKIGFRWLPYAFTENGVAMLSSVLRSDYAVQVNIQIMRAFTNLRRILTGHIEVSRKLKELEQRLDKHDEKIVSIFDAIKKMIEPPEQPKKKFGFQV